MCSYTGLLFKFFLERMLPWGCGGRACLRDAMMYMFCLRAHRYICIIFIWPTFFAKKYQSPRGSYYKII